MPHYYFPVNDAHVIFLLLCLLPPYSLLLPLSPSLFQPGLQVSLSQAFPVMCHYFFNLYAASSLPSSLH